MPLYGAGNGGKLISGKDQKIAEKDSSGKTFLREKQGTANEL